MNKKLEYYCDRCSKELEYEKEFFTILLNKEKYNEKEIFVLDSIPIGVLCCNCFKKDKKLMEVFKDG